MDRCGAAAGRTLPASSQAMSTRMTATVQFALTWISATRAKPYVLPHWPARLPSQ